VLDHALSHLAEFPSDDGFEDQVRTRYRVFFKEVHEVHTLLNHFEKHHADHLFYRAHVKVVKQHTLHVLACHLPHLILEKLVIDITGQLVLAEAANNRVSLWQDQIFRRLVSSKCAQRTFARSFDVALSHVILASCLEGLSVREVAADFEGRKLAEMVLALFSLEQYHLRERGLLCANIDLAGGHERLLPDELLLRDGQPRRSRKGIRLDYLFP